MADFDYLVIDPAGRERRGSLIAASSDDARAKLGARRFYIVRLDPAVAGAPRTAPLVAFNLELAAPATLADAKAVAARIREGGPDGLPGLRAIGIELGGSVAQLSMNVEDHLALPLAAVVAAVERLAPLAAAEVVGLPPAAAFAGYPDGLPTRGRRTLEDALTI